MSAVGLTLFQIVAELKKDRKEMGVLGKDKKEMVFWVDRCLYYAPAVRCDGGILSFVWLVCCS